MQKSSIGIDLPLTDQATNQLMAEVMREARQRVNLKRLVPYKLDPQAFVHDLITFPHGREPTDYQDGILGGFIDRRRTAVRSPHGVGKTALAAWLILWAVLTHHDVKAPTTASAWRQLEKYLWPEVHKWAGRLRWDRLGRDAFTKAELLTLSLKLSPTREAFAVATDDYRTMEGAHAERIVYVYDEAKGIPERTWDASEGAFSADGGDTPNEAYALAISTPGDAAGRFHAIHTRAAGLEDWHPVHIKLGEGIDAGMISKEWADARLRQWGEDSPVYQARVLGEFPTHAEDSLISLTWIEAARERELKPGKNRKIAGADIARFGGDFNFLFVRKGPVVLEGETWAGLDLMETTGKIRNRTKGMRTNVDVIGLGAGVVDRLVELKHDVLGVNVSVPASDPEHFYNARAEYYWGLRERFREGDIDLTRLPQSIYDRLVGDLTAIKYKYTSRGQIRIESKDDMRKRLGRSPDAGDGLMLVFAAPANDWVIS